MLTAQVTINSLHQVGSFGDMDCGSKQTFIPVRDYDLAATLTSGQAFRWQQRSGWWEGVVAARWVKLQPANNGVLAQTAEPQLNWTWLRTYLQTDVDLSSVLLSFPTDKAMQASLSACRGLRLLRQDTWECLASFILSSTKQIIQIRQIVALLCERFGAATATPRGHAPEYAFPTVERIAGCSEGELRSCKMGFRAPYLLATAKLLRDGGVDLAAMENRPVEDVRAELLKLPGVGHKIANCVLLFAYGFQTAFPLDVWVLKALTQLYFKGRKVRISRLQQFTQSYFGPNAGYAQQYLFHYMRVHARVNKPVAPAIKTR